MRGRCDLVSIRRAALLLLATTIALGSGLLVSAAALAFMPTGGGGASGQNPGPQGDASTSVAAVRDGSGGWVAQS